ncbi:hypothetical protein [Nitrospira sp. Kam-Ns4a]
MWPTSRLTTFGLVLTLLVGLSLGRPRAFAADQAGKPGPPAGSAPAANANRDGKAVADEAFRKILAEGMVVSIPPVDQLKSLVEQEGAGNASLNVPVTLQATEAARAALEAAAQELGGTVLDAVLELDYGIVSVKARSARISDDPGLIEYFQKRIGSLLLRLDLVLDDGQVYECTTGNPWRLPVTTVSTLFAYGGRPSIQGLGLSPAYDSKDYGFVAARSDTMRVIFKATIPAEDMARLQKLTAKIVVGTGDEREGLCQKAKK